MEKTDNNPLTCESSNQNLACPSRADIDLVIFYFCWMCSIACAPLPTLFLYFHLSLLFICNYYLI